MTVSSSELVQVTPSVLSAGGAGIATIGLALTLSTRVEIGTVRSFSSALAVQNFFGPGIEASGAAVYFAGFQGASQVPASLLFAQYPQSAVAAYLRGGNISAVPLTTLQALSGSLTVVIDGYSHVIASISLSAYASQSAMAAAIQAAFTEPTEASFTASIGASFTGNVGSPTTQIVVTAVTGLISVGDTITGSGVTAGTTVLSQVSGTPGGAGTYLLSAANSTSNAGCTASSHVLDVTVCAVPTIAPGQTLVNGGLTGGPILVASQVSGTTGGVGIYTMSGVQQFVASSAFTSVATTPAVTYDSQSGAFIITSGVTGTPSTLAFATGTLAAPLLLTSATGAVLSQGAAAAVPATFMNGVIQANNNWVAFKTAFDPDTLNNTGNTVKQAFAAWKNTQNNRYCYVASDSDASPAASSPAAASLGQILLGNGDSGTALIWEGTTSNPGPFYHGWFILGAIASINFSQPNGRITFAYKAQAGLTAAVTDPTTANNLAGNPQSAGAVGNGYNFYGAYASAGQNNIWFQRGTVTGLYQWLDSYINQIWLNNQLQNALLTLLGNANSVPFNNAGATIIEQSLQAAIAAGLSFGAYAPGLITASQAQQINSVAGNAAANTLQSQGWYIQIVPASGVIMQARGPQQINFWYNDRGSVQVINLSSIEIP